MSDKLERLKGLLRELFQLDQPDLDFGIYRIMHARSAEVTQFLDEDLLPQVRQAFEQYQPASRAEIQRELDEVTANVRNAGMEPEQSPRVQELRRKLTEEAVDLDQLEAEVYDHLYHFFRRYYSEGDFLAKRVYKPGVYAIPYEGEEVKLHWANKDQYYIKTSETLRDYAFRLKPHDERNPMRVHFRLVDAAEGEHGNVRATNERRFILAPGGESGRDFIGLDGGDLVIRFEYRPATMNDWPEDRRADDEARSNPKPPDQATLIDLAAARVLAVEDEALGPWLAELGRRHTKADGSGAGYSRLVGHLKRYTARNTFDYFIHKDLGGFLRRELDFFIKNEIMHLDDIETETAPRVEQYLSKIRVIRSIAHKIIDFLAQLEDFQKKLWLKKKFVVETNYCITLDLIPEEFYLEIAANETQHNEWVTLFGIDEIEARLGSPGYSQHLSTEFMKANTNLVVDTRHFTQPFIEKLLARLVDNDSSSSGVVINGDNFQALQMLRARFGQSVDLCFIDPPYNTGNDGFTYKDRYRHSSWSTMMADRLSALRKLLADAGSAWCTIDDNEVGRLLLLVSEFYGEDNVFPPVVWQHSAQGRGYQGSITVQHNYLLSFRRTSLAEIGVLDRTEEHNRNYSNPDNDPKGPWRSGDVRNALYRPNLIYDLRTPSGKVISPPERGWRWSRETMQSKIASGEIFFADDETRIVRKIYLSEQEGRVPESIWLAKDVGSSRSANSELKAFFGDARPFDTPKPSGLVETCIRLGAPEAGVVLDCFAGSGTTAHAVINTNRTDGASRVFVLVEMGEHFDTAIIPRVKKVSYSANWKDGKPSDRELGYSLFMKYVRLESYEDAVNNIALADGRGREQLLDSLGSEGMREEYLLRYMLDVETRGSQSLLNIDAFVDPTAYKLKVKRPGSDETREVNVDLLETFNWLIGLTVQHIAAPQTLSAEFERDAEGRLQVRDRLRPADDGPYWFRTVTGTTPDGRKTLVIWRKRPGGEDPAGIEQDNLALNEWFTRSGYSTRDYEFDLIYVNGDNNLENLKTPDDTWKVRLIEEDFHRLMFDVDDV